MTRKLTLRMVFCYLCSNFITDRLYIINITAVFKTKFSVCSVTNYKIRQMLTHFYTQKPWRPCMHRQSNCYFTWNDTYWVHDETRTEQFNNTQYEIKGLNAVFFFCFFLVYVKNAAKITEHYCSEGDYSKCKQANGSCALHSKSSSTIFIQSFKPIPCLLCKKMAKKNCKGMTTQE